MITLLEVLLPAISGLVLEQWQAQPEQISLMMRMDRRRADCPLCQQPSGRIHSHYTRTVADLPWAGIPVRMEVMVRRFFCDQPNCIRWIFSERLGSGIPVYARRTQRLTNQLQQVAFGLGGEAGAATVSHLSMAVSADTLLRLIGPEELPQATTPRVLGVDEWAKRKGRSYGLILVDLERRRPVDLLADCSAEALADWLKAHPGVEIISRDRSQLIIQGATTGAPEAVQVADRFHLLQNMTETVQRLLDKEPKALREAAKQAAQAQQPPPLPDPALGEVPAEPQPEAIAEPAKAPTWAQLRFAEVKALQQQGWSQRQIAHHLSLNRRTVSRYWSLESYPEPVRGAQCTSTVLPYLDYLSQRWQAGCRNCKVLFEELVQQGYQGSYMSVWRAVTRYLNKNGQASAAVKPQPRIKPLSARQAAWLLSSPPEKLKPEQETLRQILCECSTRAATAYELAQAFVTMIRERQVERLDKWLEAAKQSGIVELKRFAASLQRDYQAVKAALELPWSNKHIAYCTSSTP